MFTQLVVGLIRIYQSVSRLTPSVCRFQPSCSEYSAQAILRYGVYRGSGKAVRRILRCHPWSQGGFDPVN